MVPGQPDCVQGAPEQSDLGFSGRGLLGTLVSAPFVWAGLAGAVDWTFWESWSFAEFGSLVVPRFGAPPLLPLLIGFRSVIVPRTVPGLCRESEEV